MYCPSCGVKNEGSPLKCFVCGFILPSSDRGAGSGARARRPALSSANAEPYAAIGDRMLALVIDRVLILALLAIPVAMMAERWSKSGAQPLAPLRTAIVASIAVVLLVLAYHIVLEALFGATLGKGLLGLQVRTDSDDGRWLAAAIRNVARIVDGILFYSVAFLVAVFTRRRQRLGDLFAGTTVVEQQVPWGARVALIFISIALLAGSVWLASWLCPSCVPDRSRFSF